MRDGTTQNCVKIEMLGGFSVSYEGKTIGLGHNTRANFLRLLQILWLNSENGVSKDQLLNSILGYKDLSDEGNSFYNLLYQARKKLKSAGFPGDKYIEGTNGVFLPEAEIPLYVDAIEFRKLCRDAEAEADSRIRRELYKEAFALYKGELLPDLSTEVWVIQESVALGRFYEKCIQYLGAAAQDEKNYDEMYRVYEKARDIYPDHDWQVYMIQALILKKDYQAAYKLYDDIVVYYQEKLGLPVSEALRECFRQIEESSRNFSDDITDIQANILVDDKDAFPKDEAKHPGAYFCTFSVFSAAYHILRRNMERRGVSVYMMLCTLVDYKGEFIQNEDKLIKRMEALKTAIHDSLRQGDVYTKYSNSQYLILLVGARADDFNIIGKRIAGNLKTAAGNRAEMNYRIVSLADLPLLS